MNTTDLAAELRNQAQDRPEPADLLATLTRGRTVRRSRLAAAGLAAVVVVVIFLGVTISGRATPTHPAIPASTPTSLTSTASASTFALVCAGAIRATAVPDGSLTQVQGVVAIATGPQQVSANSQQPGRYYDPAQQYFAKSGLQIKAGQAFRIQVPPAWRGRAEIGWSNIHVNPADVMTVPACPRVRVSSSPASSTQTGTPAVQWLTYPGGIWVSAPACVPLQIITATAVTTVHIPVGASCP
jgi:hypothetical protein